MVYIRFTEKAELLEIRKDYMRSSEEIKMDFETVLGKIALITQPFKMRIVGETRSGGFMANMLVHTIVEDNLFFIHKFEDVGKNIIDIIQAYSKAKKKGYLRMDGIVESIREPYKNYFVEIRPLKGRYKYITIRMDNYLNSIYVEGNNKTLEIINEQIRYAVEIKIDQLFTIVYFDAKRKADIERQCRMYSKIYRCETKGYVYSNRGYGVYTLFIPDTKPPRILYSMGELLMPTCKCKIHVNKYTGDYYGAYVYVKDDLVKLLHPDQQII